MLEPTLHQSKEELLHKETSKAVQEIAWSYNVHNSTISRLPS